MPCNLLKKVTQSDHQAKNSTFHSAHYRRENQKIRQPLHIWEEKICYFWRKKLFQLSDIFHGVSPQQVRRIAYEYATNDNINHNSSHVSEMAGKDWFYAFLRRTPTISFRKPEAISMNRITFNREEVAKFYTNLETVMSQIQYLPNQINEVDETGISTVQDLEPLLPPKEKNVLAL
ncbi:hypothetical protein JTB14_014241 [Gonioctena quinquepunctata]|nr:hypothetical protein JTB14_014241 [Gonioctena quinquepunctata]